MEKILIANRGEIAVRIIGTARQLGYRTVAVYSAADAQGLHVQLADEAVPIGAAGVSESYLVGEKIIQAARLTGADAIHPGYGFLSENAEFARVCEEAGITFIGPSAEAIELMASKRLSKLAMLEAGVPCIPGYQGAQQDDVTLVAEAKRIGFPLMVKASAGGGGRGMRLVQAENQLQELIKTARSEARGAFGSDELILEKAVLEPRHIEVQVFADSHGNVVYLGERDCSIQRRHQKVVEEAPSPFVDEDLRQRMGQAAVNAAKACNYRGAGTVEFLVDADKQFYFLEMNTRLQVEHPVTEMITGQDLVAWQLQVAAGEALPLTQAQISLTGHAVEVRLYAEDPRQGFMPQTGTVHAWQAPERDGVRIDHGIQVGQQVSSHYDPMLAKMIAYGDNRQQAIRRLASAVQDTQLLGLNSNKLFLQRVLRHSVFTAGEATTAFIEQHFSDDASLQKTPTNATIARAALAFYVSSPWQTQALSWQATNQGTYHYQLACDEQVYSVQLKQLADQNYDIEVAGECQQLQCLAVAEQGLVLLQQGIRSHIAYHRHHQQLYVDDGGGHFQFVDVTHVPASTGAAASSGVINASMDGAIVAVMVAPGEKVQIGQTLVVLEAMKMEHPLKATMHGIVGSVSCEPGQQVKSKQVLVNLIKCEDENENEQ